MGPSQHPVTPPAGGPERLDDDQVSALAARLPEWTVVDAHHLVREYRFPDFASALALVVAVGAEAEASDHHPELQLSWGRVGVLLFTHDVGGLTQSDFSLASRIEQLYSEQARQPQAAADPPPTEPSA